MRTSLDLSEPPEAVWERLADLASHMEWMRDARTIRFQGDRRQGVGTVLEVETRVGPFRTNDRMEVVGWDPPRRLAVAHRGRVRGHGEFLLEPAGGGTRLVWSEDLRFPWYLGGPLGVAVAGPVLRRVFLADLMRFRSLVEGG